MKKLLLLAIAMQSLYAYGQIEKKRWIGNLKFNGYSELSKTPSGPVDVGVKFDNFSTSISVGKMISNKWLFGLGLSYGYDHHHSYNSSVPANTNAQTTNSYGFSIVGNYYSSIATNLFFTSSYSAGYAFGKIRDVGLTVSNYNRDTKKYTLNTEPIGIAYLFKKRYLVQLYLLRISYFNAKESDNISFGVDNINARLEYSFNPLQNGISFSYIFKNKKDVKKKI